MSILIESLGCPHTCEGGTHITPSSSTRAQGEALAFIISNHSEIGAGLQNILQELGIRSTVGITSGAIEKIEQLRPNLVVLDFAEDNTGLDLCHLLHTGAGSWRAPVILVAESDDIPTKAKALKCGAVDFLTKPLQKPEVIARVRMHLRLQRALESLADLNAAHVHLIAAAQQSCMARPQDLPEARFHVHLQQIHRAGGDFYDVVDHGRGEIVDYVVADTSGHDVSSSFWTLALKTLLNEYSDLLFSPLDSFYLINRSLLRILPPGVFFTASQVQLDRHAGNAVVLSAGHPPLLHIPYDEAQPANIIRQTADVLGAFSDASFSRIDLQVDPQDRLFLFSDGLIDLFGPFDEGLQKLVSTAQSLRKQSLRSAVDQIVSSQLQNKVPQDDILLMGIEV